MANEKRLTEADKIAYCTIKEFIRENGYPPSVRELCRITGKASTSSIQYRLKSLEEKGCIKITHNGRRTIRLVEKADAVEVVHGHNLKDYDSAFECSVCGWEDWDTLTADSSKYNYCPNCGAKMDGDGNG